MTTCPKCGAEIDEMDEVCPGCMAQPPLRSSAVLSGVESYFCVIDPHGNIVHPTISLSREEAINQWLEQEQAMHLVANAGRAMRKQKPICAPSWEQCEAEGYKCLPVKLEVINAK